MTDTRQRFDHDDSHPLQRMVRTALALPALAGTLGCSDRQVETLSRLKEQFMDARRAYRQRMKESHEALTELFTSGETPEAPEVRRHLTERATRRADHRATLYERALEMRGVLTEGQRKVLAHLTLRDLRCQVRRHMTLVEERQLDEAVREVAGPDLSDSEPAVERSRTEKGRPGEDSRNWRDRAPGPVMEA